MYTTVCSEKKDFQMMDVKSKRSVTSYFVLALKIFKIVPSLRFIACDIIGIIFWISLMLVVRIYFSLETYKELLFKDWSKASIAESVNNASDMFIQPLGDALEIIAVAYLAFLYKPLTRK